MVSDKKRRRRRYDLELAATVVKVGREKKQTAVHTRNISSTGIFIEFDQELEAGTIIEVEVDLPREVTPEGPLRLRCMGQVVRVDRGDTTGVAVAIKRYEFLRPPEQ